jgi:DNA-binding transcriptional regulator YiaG
MTEDLASRPESEEEWQKAQQRVSLYLRLMHLPPLESLELALQALKQARQTPGEASPLSKSMHVLRQLLREWERGRKKPETDDVLDLIRIPLPAPLGRSHCGGIRSRPLHNRGFMVPEKVR